MKSCNIKPLNGKILIKFKPEDRQTLEERKTDGGIFIPNTVKETLLQALVLAVADDVTQCKAGDIVLVHHNDGMDILAADHKTLLRFLSAGTVYGVIQREEIAGNNGLLAGPGTAGKIDAGAASARE